MVKVGGSISSLDVILDITDQYLTMSPFQPIIVVLSSSSDPSLLWNTMLYYFNTQMGIKISCVEYHVFYVGSNMQYDVPHTTNHNRNNKTQRHNFLFSLKSRRMKGVASILMLAKRNEQE